MRDNFLNTPNPTEGKVSTLKDVQNVGVRNTCVPFKQGTGLFYTCTQSDFPSDESGDATRNRTILPNTMDNPHINCPYWDLNAEW